MNSKVKILVIDDSISYRQIIMAVIKRIDNAECVATAASGTIGLRKIKMLEPDLVLLDVVMPEMDGVETLQQIKQEYPHVEAIMMSSFNMNNAKETLRSLSIGALDFVTKPNGQSAEDSITELANYLRPFVHLVETKKYAKVGRQPVLAPVEKTQTKPTVTSTSKAESKNRPPRSLRASRRGKIDLILIGVSTGGPKALDELVPAFNTSMPCPIIIVQHMPALFTESLAQKLNSNTELNVMEVKGGEYLTAGHIYIAQGGKHLEIKKRPDARFQLLLNDNAPVNNCRPSVDVLFNSVAQLFKGRVLAVMMTGMGSDGTEGVKNLKRHDCHCLIQNEASSIVWGMPGSVHRAGLADEVLSLKQLSQRINELIF